MRSILCFCRLGVVFPREILISPRTQGRRPYMEDRYIAIGRLNGAFLRFLPFSAAWAPFPGAHIVFIQYACCATCACSRVQMIGTPVCSACLMGTVAPEQQSETPHSPLLCVFEGSQLCLCVCACRFCVNNLAALLVSDPCFPSNPSRALTNAFLATDRC